MWVYMRAPDVWKEILTGPTRISSSLFGGRIQSLPSNVARCGAVLPEQPCAAKAGSTPPVLLQRAPFARLSRDLWQSVSLHHPRQTWEALSREEVSGSLKRAPFQVPCLFGTITEP